MVHNLIYQIARLLIIVRANLRRQRHLLVVLVRPTNDIQVDPSALARKDSGAHALLGEVDLRAVDLVEHDGGDGAHDLQGKVVGLDDVDGGDEGVDDEGEAGRVFDGDLVGFALDDDGGGVAAGYKDGLVEGGFDFDWCRFFFEVFLKG